jgi:tetratricopeptide (TPR) repeat protein
MQRADAAFRAGLAARQAGNLEASRVQFAEAVRLAPGIAEAHEALGAVLLELGKPADAAAELDAALGLKQGDPAIETDLALAYATAGRPEKAIAHFSAVYALAQTAGQQPVDAAFCDAYARALAATGHEAEAIRIFDAEEDRAGSQPDIDDAVGSLYAQMGNRDEARRRFEHAIAQSSAYVLPRIHLGILLRQQHDFEGSIAALKVAIALEPGNGSANLEYGRTLESAKRDEDATPFLEQAAKSNPDLPGVQDELAMALQRLGRQQEAIPWFQKALEREPHNVSIFTNLGLALTLTGKAKDALAYFQSALAESPKDAVIYKDLGVAHVQLSAFDEAIGDFQAALALDATDPQLHYDLGMAYKFKDRMDEAVAELNRAEQLDPALQDPPYTLGILYMQIGKLDEAAVELRKAVALRPENGDAWAILGSVLKQDSRLDEAAGALRKAVALMPNQPGPPVTLAGVLASQASAAMAAADAADAAGDAQKAEQERGDARELRSQAVDYRKQAADLSRSAVNRQKAAFATNAGNQLLLRGQIADAIARYQEAIAADPTFADAHSQLAAAYERQGRADDAAAERARATALTQAK